MLMTALTLLPSLVLFSCTGCLISGNRRIIARENEALRPVRFESSWAQEQFQARLDLFNAIIQGEIYPAYKIRVKADEQLVEDPGGDQLDALLCCIQAAWA